MGVKIDAQKNSGSEYVKAVSTLADSFLNRVARPWLWFEMLFNIFPGGRQFTKALKILRGFTAQVRLKENP